MFSHKKTDVSFFGYTTLFCPQTPFGGVFGFMAGKYSVGRFVYYGTEYRAYLSPEKFL